MKYIINSISQIFINMGYYVLAITGVFLGLLGVYFVSSWTSIADGSFTDAKITIIVKILFPGIPIYIISVIAYTYFTTNKDKGGWK